ncbi:MAG: hypothetical protein DMF85_20070 [Acidobacteria bacterium]|nr:MAG: hypothetical protein DMF85_20070 [Acidobacteriota bacterium]
MRLDQQSRPSFNRSVWRVAAALLFASGLALSVSGQTPPAQNPPPATPAPAMPPVHESPIAGGMPLSIDDAVKLALENNLGIQQEKLNPQIQAYGVARALGVFTPALFSNFNRRSSTAPPTDFLSQGVAVATSGNLATTAGLQQQTKWYGGSYSVAWDGSRATSDAPHTSFRPQLGSDLSAIYTQPLLRNFKIDSFREQLLLSRNSQQVADIQLQERITQTSRNVRAAYYNLVGAIAGLEVAQQSLDLARQSLHDNQRRVEVGTMAPIDIVAAEAEVASNDENVIVAQANIQSAEDQLRALVMNPSQPGFWATIFRPTEQPALAPRAIDVDAAIANALANRTDIQQLKKQIESTDVSMKFAANQKLPTVDVTGRYGVTGVGGTLYDYIDSTTPGAPPIATVIGTRSFMDALRDVFGNNYRTWSVAVNVSYPIGTSVADAAYAQGKIQREQENTQLENLKLQVATAVREAGRGVNTNLKRVEATRRARELAEKRLEAEQKRFTVGLSTTFELFQAQRDLSRARQAELTATIDYNRSLVDFEAVQASPIGGR